MIYNAKYNKEEALLRQNGKSLLSDSSESSDNKYEDNNGTGSEDKNCHCKGAGNSACEIVAMLPASLFPIFGDEGRNLRELHVIVKAWVQTKYKEFKRLVRPILIWLI